MQTPFPIALEPSDLACTTEPFEFPFTCTYYYLLDDTLQGVCTVGSTEIPTSSGPLTSVPLYSVHNTTQVINGGLFFTVILETGLAGEGCTPFIWVNDNEFNYQFTDFFSPAPPCPGDIDANVACEAGVSAIYTAHLTRNIPVAPGTFFNPPPTPSGTSLLVVSFFGLLMPIVHFFL